MSLLNRCGYPILDGIVFVAFLSLVYATASVFVPSCLLLIIVAIVVRIIRPLFEAGRVDSEDKYVLITGCDTGIGFALARVLDRKGFSVFATCLSDVSDGAVDLKRSGSSRMRVFQLDVTSDESVSNCLQKVQTICGETGLWSLVNNAGTSLSGDVEIQSLSTIRYYAELNLFGVTRICKAFLPLVRKRKGRVVNVTSVRGRLAIPTSAAYCMSKFGAEGFSESLRLEMKRFGVKVIIVAPGNYGLNVGHYDKRNRPIMESKYRQMIAAVDDDVRSAYGEEYLQSFVKYLPTAYPFSESKLRGILEALESAVAAVHPRSRYLVDGTNVLVDGNCMMARLRDILPEYLMDSILMWMRPLPREAFYSTQCTELSR